MKRLALRVMVLGEGILWKVLWSLGVSLQRTVGLHLSSLSVLFPDVTICSDTRSCLDMLPSANFTRGHINPYPQSHLGHGTLKTVSYRNLFFISELPQVFHYGDATLTGTEGRRTSI
jgi:hypothetical protein